MRLKVETNGDLCEIYVNDIKVDTLSKMRHVLGKATVDNLFYLIHEGITIDQDKLIISDEVDKDLLIYSIYSLYTFDEHIKTGPIFLGGTCNASTWRDEIQDKILYETFNPVVSDWTPSCQIKEIQMRDNARYNLTVITPQMKAPYSIAEAVEDAILNPSRSIFCYLSESNGDKFDDGMIRSLDMVSKMISKHGGLVLSSLDEVVTFLNFKYNEQKHMEKTIQDIVSGN